MSSTSRILSADGKQAVELAIAAAERKTSGEIVVVVARRSGCYDRGEDLFGVLVAIAAVVAAWLLWQGVAVDHDWAPRFSPVLGLIPVVAIFLGGFTLGAVIATLVPQLGLFFTTRADMFAEVKERAELAFHRFSVRKTAAGTGVLVYISLLERMVWVVGDTAVSERIAPEEWAGVRDQLVADLRRGDAAGGLERSVAKVGELLAAEFPPVDGDIDEIGNQVHFVD